MSVAQFISKAMALLSTTTKCRYVRKQPSPTHVAEWAIACGQQGTAAGKRRCHIGAQRNLPARSGSPCCDLAHPWSRSTDCDYFTDTSRDLL